MSFWEIYTTKPSSLVSNKSSKYRATLKNALTEIIIILFLFCILFLASKTSCNAINISEDNFTLGSANVETTDEQIESQATLGDEDNQGLSDKEGANENPKIVVYGDSIAWGQVRINSENNQTPNNWPYIFGQLSQSEVSNNAIPGTCLARGNGYGMTEQFNVNAFCNRIETEDLSEYDYLMIAYGTNDYGFVIPLGDIDTTPSKDTFLGALHYVLDIVADKYPYLKVVLLTPMVSA